MSLSESACQTRSVVPSVLMVPDGKNNPEHQRAYQDIAGIRSRARRRSKKVGLTVNLHFLAVLSAASDGKGIKGETPTWDGMPPSI